jgi:hypothetical protein
MVLHCGLCHCVDVVLAILSHSDSIKAPLSKDFASALAQL